MPNRPARTRGTMSGRSLPGKRAFGKNAGILGGNAVSYGDR